jgi:NADH-quinone oxidoreductase subunit J
MYLESLFVFFSIGMILCMVSVLLSKNSVISVVSLIGFFLNGAGLLFFFRAEYLGIVYVVVYIGAIAVLFLFVVMMLDFKTGSDIYNYKTEYFISSLMFLTLFFLYIYNFFMRIFYVSYNYNYFKTSYVYKNLVNYIEPITDMVTIGNVLYTHYFLFFLLCGFLLFVAMIGAIVLTLFKREGVRVQSLSDQIMRQASRSVYYN